MAPRSLVLTIPRSCRWLPALLLGAAAGTAAARPPAYSIPDAKAVAEALREASRGQLVALGRSVDLAAGCGGRPGVKIPAVTADDRRQVQASPTAISVVPQPSQPINWACMPSDMRLVQATRHTLMAIATLKADHPAVAADLQIKPGSQEEAKRLARGLGMVLATLGPATQRKAGKQ